MSDGGGSSLRAAGSSLTHFDMMRGLAAIAVVVGHVRGLFFLDYGRIGSHGVLLKAFYMATGLGHQAVVVFFVLSGFFIGTSVVDASRAGTWSWSSYLLRRLTRLYVVLVPALVLTAILDRIGMHYFGTDGVYGGHIVTPLTLEDASRSSGPTVVLANLAFLQTFAGYAAFGTNGPLWSLSYEFWAYVFFPLLVRALFGGWRSRLVHVLAAAGIVVIGGKTFIVYFLIWAMGAVVAAVWPRCRTKNVRLVRLVTGAAMVSFAATLLAARSFLLPRGPLADIPLGLVTAALVLALLSGHGPPVPSTAFGRRYASGAKWLAAFSFTLYLVHYPVLVLVEASCMGGDMWLPTLVPMLLAAAITAAVTLLVAYPIGRVTEGNTDSVRRWIAAHFGLLRDVEK